MKIGLFGTCGSSTWRKEFVNAYNERGIEYFNPQLPEGVWKADMADEFVRIENENLKTNEIILFSVTNETTGQGSLAEIGFSVLDTVRNLKNRYLIVMIDSDCKDVKATESQIEESCRSRKLVLSKLQNEFRKNPNLFLVKSLDDMLSLSLELHQHYESMNDLKAKYCA